MSRRPSGQGPACIGERGPGPWPGQGALVELGDQLAGGDVGAAPRTSWLRPPCFGSCLGACSWEVAPMGPLSPEGYSRPPNPLWEPVAFQK